MTLVAILDADKEGFLRSAWSLIQMIGRAARNIGGEVVMYADRITESMKVAIDETDRRRAIQSGYNVEHGIEPQTIIKEIRDINDRLRAVAEDTGRLRVRAARRGARGEPTRRRSRSSSRSMEAEMRAAAKQLEFERAAALRDEIQQIRLRVLDEDASVRRAPGRRNGPVRARRWPPKERGERRTRPARGGGATMPAPCSRSRRSRSCRRARSRAATTSPRTARRRAVPGIRDEHEDGDGGWQARWLDRPTWDHTVTPNIRRRTGQRPSRRARGY